MNNNKTQQELYDAGFEHFAHSGEYLVCGTAEIYIDKGDDDIIQFHDGSHYIRFIISHRDMTFFYKGKLDFLRVGDNTDFSMRVVSERLSFGANPFEQALSDIVTKLTELHNHSVECCKMTNKNLVKVCNSIAQLKSTLVKPIGDNTSDDGDNSINPSDKKISNVVWKENNTKQLTVKELVALKKSNIVWQENKSKELIIKK